MIKVKKGTVTNFIKDNRDKLIVLYIFPKDWSPPKAFKSAMKTNVSRFPKTVFGTVDAHACSKEIVVFVLQTLPSIIFLRDGREVDRITEIDCDLLYETIKKHQPQKFTGTPRTLAPPSPQSTPPNPDLLQITDQSSPKSLENPSKISQSNEEPILDTPPFSSPSESQFHKIKPIIPKTEEEKKMEYEKRQREREIAEIKKGQYTNKSEKERVLQRIKEQRESMARYSKPAPISKPTPQNTNICQLRLVFPDKKAEILQFNSDDTLGTVESKIKEITQKISFEIPYPRKILDDESFGKTLKQLQLCPRSQLSVTLN